MLDVRIIVASHEDLRLAHEHKTFREDLYHRLNEFSIQIPPLRKREKDIPGFASYFLKLTNEETGKQIKGFKADVMELFLAYSWPGNIRELRNVIRRAVLLTPSGMIGRDALSPELFHAELEGNLKQNNAITIKTNSQNKDNNLKAVGQEAEYQTIIKVLKSVDFNKSKAAKILDIDRKTLYNKLKEYGRL